MQIQNDFCHLVCVPGLESRRVHWFFHGMALQGTDYRRMAGGGHVPWLGGGSYLRAVTFFDLSHSCELHEGHSLGFGASSVTNCSHMKLQRRHLKV